MKSLTLKKILAVTLIAFSIGITFYGDKLPEDTSVIQILKITIPNAVKLLESEEKPKEK